MNPGSRIVLICFWAPYFLSLEPPEEKSLPEGEDHTKADRIGEWRKQIASQNKEEHADADQVK